MLVPNVCAIALYHYSPWGKNSTFQPERVCPKHSWIDPFIILLLLPYLGLEKSQNFSLPIFSFTCPGHFLACPIIFRINSVRNGNSLVLISTL